jgi:hypothetical protein
MERPTLEYIARLGTCWTRAKLDAARERSPLPDPPTWSAFLGSRLSTMTLPEVFERVQVALQHVSLQRVPMPQGERAGEMWKRCRAMEKPELLSFAENLGVFLDSDPQPATAKPTSGE